MRYVGLRFLHEIGFKVGFLGILIPDLAEQTLDPRSTNVQPLKKEHSTMPRNGGLEF